VLADNEVEGRADITVAQVQTFLEKKGSALARYTEGGRTAADVIVSAGRAWNISPLYLLARIQTESSLITSGSLDKVRQATGCACPDGGGCDASKATFTIQVQCASRWMRDYFNELRDNGVTRAGWRVGVGKTTLDGCWVTPANRATAALYTYTPHAGAYAIGCGGPWGGTSLVAVAFRLYAPDFGTATPGTWSCASSSHNGAQYWTCSGNARVRCDSAGVVKREDCPMGCFSRPAGTDDLCISKTTSWTCARSSYGGAQWWTCNTDGSLYKCDGVTPTVVRCPSGCTVGALGTHDRCR
jgi:hypothetical protein